MENNGSQPCRCRMEKLYIPPWLLELNWFSGTPKSCGVKTWKKIAVLRGGPNAVLPNLLHFSLQSSNNQLESKYVELKFTGTLLYFKRLNPAAPYIPEGQGIDVFLTSVQRWRTSTDGVILWRFLGKCSEWNDAWMSRFDDSWRKQIFNRPQIVKRLCETAFLHFSSSSLAPVCGSNCPKKPMRFQHMMEAVSA